MPKPWKELRQRSKLSTEQLAAVDRRVADEVAEIDAGSKGPRSSKPISVKE